MNQRRWIRKFNKAVGKVQKSLELKSEARVDITVADYHYTDKELEVKDNK